MPDNQMEAAIIYESHLPDALRRAIVYAGNDGFVASLPQLLHARLGASFDNIIWNTWFTANSEECVARTPHGNWVLIVVHGGGIFATPERIRTLYHASVDRKSELGFTGLFAGKISERENHDLVDGRLPGGRQIPVYAFSDFERGTADPRTQAYAVVMDLEMAKRRSYGLRRTSTTSEDDPLMTVRAGGSEHAAAYLDKAKSRGNTGRHRQLALSERDRARSTPVLHLHDVRQPRWGTRTNLRPRRHRPSARRTHRLRHSRRHRE